MNTVEQYARFNKDHPSVKSIKLSMNFTVFRNARALNTEIHDEYNIVHKTDIILEHADGVGGDVRIIPKRPWRHAHSLRTYTRYVQLLCTRFRAGVYFIKYITESFRKVEQNTEWPLNHRDT